MKTPIDNFNEVNHPDDHFFRHIMSKKVNVQAYLKYFNPEISQHIKLDSLEHSSETFVDEKLDFFQSDIVYRCELKDSKKTIYVCFLWEHKSSPETYVSLQIGLYIFHALYKMSKEKGRKIEIILPFLFYNGEVDWKPKTVHDLFKATPQFSVFQNYIPNFQFIFKNIVKSKEAELFSIQEAFFRSAMFAMASRNDVDLIIQRISLIFGKVEEQEIIVILNYILHFIKNDNELVDAIKGSDSSVKHKVMTAIEQLEERFTRKGILKGLQEGLERGVQKGLQKGLQEGLTKGVDNTIIKLYLNGMSIKRIAIFLELSSSCVQKVIESPLAIKSRGIKKGVEDTIQLLFKNGLSIKKITDFLEKEEEYISNIVITKEQNLENKEQIDLNPEDIQEGVNSVISKLYKNGVSSNEIENYLQLELVDILKIIDKKG